MISFKKINICKNEKQTFQAKIVTYFIDTVLTVNCIDDNLKTAHRIAIMKTNKVLVLEESYRIRGRPLLCGYWGQRFLCPPAAAGVFKQNFALTVGRTDFYQEIEFLHLDEIYRMTCLSPRQNERRSSYFNNK